MKKYYRFTPKVLSFCQKDTFVFQKSNIRAEFF